MKQKKIQMNVDQPIVLLHDYGSGEKIKVVSKSDTKEPISILITGKNLVKPKFHSGKIEMNEIELQSSDHKKHLTSSWFPVSSKVSEYLVMSGDGYNCALWQFMTQDGELAKEGPKPRKLIELRDPEVAFHGKTYSIAQIPNDAAYARVYFADLSTERKEIVGDRLQIEYGRIPTKYEAYREKKITLPALKAGSEIIYENRKWILKNGNKSKRLFKPALSITRGDIIRLSGGIGTKVAINYEVMRLPKGKKYGIRHKISDSYPMCERIDDAKGLYFKYTMRNKSITPFRNDFDKIYPWSEIKLCAIKHDEAGNRKITYQGEEGFKRTGESGQVMVEIPKFYTRREIKDGYDYLWISQEELSGFKVDPAFLTADGTCEHIYIGAYFSSVNGNQLNCVSKTEPMIKCTMNEIRSLTAQTDGGHFKECDLNVILAVQKLFLIETATLDSQSIFDGVVFLPYLIKNKKSSYYAIETNMATNTIILWNTSVTRRFKKDDTISILRSWNEYKNIPGEYQRKVLRVKKREDKKIEITFSGSPVDIYARKTGITCLPRVNGDTDIIKYHSGRRPYKVGLSSFKYRHIENLWGNLSIFIEDAWVKNNRLTIRFPNGKSKMLSYKLPEQNSILLPNEFGDPANMCIKEMGYDPNMPEYMFPVKIGDGASTSTYYCDGWYNMSEHNKKYLLTYGGAWDNKAYAGIFNFRAEFNGKSRMPYNGSRIMLRN